MNNLYARAVFFVENAERALRFYVLAKVGDWLDAGVKLVWVIDSARADAHVHRADGSLSVIDSDAALDGEDVLPGFSCPMSDVFDR